VQRDYDNREITIRHIGDGAISAPMGPRGKVEKQYERGKEGGKKEGKNGGTTKIVTVKRRIGKRFYHTGE